MDIFNQEHEQVVMGLGILADCLTVSGVSAFADVLIDHLDAKALSRHPVREDVDVIFIGAVADPTTAGAFLYIDQPDRVEDLILYTYEGLVYPSYHCRTTGYDQDTIERYMTGPYLDDSEDPIEVMALSMVNSVFAMLSYLLDIPIRVEEMTYEQHARARNVRVPNAR